MDLLYPEHLDFDHAVPQIYDVDTLYPWIPETSTDPMAIVEPFMIKCPAPKETDWEMKKPTIEQFYLTENQTLNATITCMREQHGFTATEKMYKRHFQLWGWHKYTTKAVRRESKFGNRHVVSTLPPEDHEPPKKKPRIQEEPDNFSQPQSIPSTLIPVDLKNFQQKATIFSGINELVDSHVRTGTTPSRPDLSSKYQLIQGGSGPRLRDGLYEALNTLNCKKKLGWEAVERIFDQIQYHIKEDDITSFVELCFLIPRALLFSTQSPSRALRSYLSRLTHTLREKNIQGRFAEVGHLLQDIYKHQSGSGLLDLMTFASSVLAAAFVDKYGKEDRKSLLATWDSLRLAWQLTPSVASTWLEQWELIHKDCMSRFGRHGLLTLGLEDDLAGLVQSSRLYPQADCPAGIGDLINSVRRKLFLIPSEGNGSSFNDDSLFLVHSH